MSLLIKHLTIKEIISKIIQSKIFYILLFLIAFINILGHNLIKKSSIYEVDETEFIGTLENMQIEEDKIKYTISHNREKLTCNYYLKESESSINTYELGSTVSILGTLKMPLNNTVANTFNYKKYLYNHNSFYTCTASKVSFIKKNNNLFYKIKNAVIKRIMSFDTRDYLYTMIIGDKSLMDDDVLNSYRKNGVTHLFAISGMHIGLFTMIILKMMKKMHLKENKGYLITIFFIWFYAFLVGFTPSVMRSCLLFTILSLNKLLKLKISTMQALLLSGFILIMIDYKIIFDIGFIYSFTITFGLMNSSPFLKKHSIIGTSLVATLYSLPITVYNFYKINLFSIINNLIFVPLVTIIIYPLCLITFIFKFFNPLLRVSIMFLELINTFLAKIDVLTFVIPKMPFLLILFYYFVLFWKFNKKPKKVSIGLIMLLLLTKITPFLDTNYYVDFIDVGQGDSSIIIFPHASKVIMIDTGGTLDYNKSNYHVSENTIIYLNSRGIENIDLLILTHGDADHLGDSTYVIENINVESIMLNKGDLNRWEMELKNTMHVLEDYPGVKLLNNKLWSDENTNSLVISMNLGGVDFLFMGDAPKAVEKNIIKENPNLKASIIKLGHHGSKTSSDEYFLRSIKPKWAIISSGRNNIYGHPDKETINTLEKLKIPFLNTQEVGTISFKIKNGYVTQEIFPP